MRLMSRNVLRKMASSEARRYGSSQSNFHCLYLSAMGCNAKFIEPMLSEHISGEKAAAAAMRSSIVIMKLPPVVMLTTASVDCLMTGRKRLNSAGSPEGRRLEGAGACRCRISAPAFAAPIACAAMSSGLYGSASDMVGVWIEPVIAQLTITLLD